MAQYVCRMELCSAQNLLGTRRRCLKTVCVSPLPFWAEVLQTDLFWVFRVAPGSCTDAPAEVFAVCGEAVGVCCLWGQWAQSSTKVLVMGL